MAASDQHNDNPLAVSHRYFIGAAARWVFATTLLPLVTFCVQLLIWPALSPYAWTLFFPTVFLAAWLGGSFAGVAATVLTSVLVWWRFVPPEGSLFEKDARHLLAAAIFVVAGMIFSTFQGRLRQAARAWGDALAESERGNRRLRELLNQRAIFMALIEHSSDFIGIADAEGHPVYLNPAGRQMVGLASDYPLESTRIPDYYPTELRPFASEVIVKAMQEQGRWEGETYFRHWQTQQPIPVSDTHFMIREAQTGRTLGMGTITRDISEIKRVRDELEAVNRKLNEANQEITRFFASVSHELRTPLALILGPTQRILKARETPASVRHDLEVVVRNARTLLQHVNELLDISKLQADAVSADYAETDLARLARFVASHFGVLAQERQIRYAVQIEDRLNAEIDPDKTQHVLLNLLSNAFRFTPENGQIRLTVRGEPDWVVLEVADTGPGIPPHERATIFEPCRQVSRQLGRKPGEVTPPPIPGTGLGLTIARDFVRLHRGSISVTDAPEGGALFVVRLPLRAPVDATVRLAAGDIRDVGEVRRAVEDLRAEAEVVSSGNGPERGVQVLVVEDNIDMNRFMCEVLSAQYRVAAAFDGSEGLRRAVELTPDIVLTDIMMPQMSGIELLHEVRKTPELSDTFLIVLTAKADDELRLSLLREGVQDYLIKPFPAEELLARVGNLMALRRAGEALRLSEARCSDILSIASDAIISVDSQQRVTMFNPGAERIFGYSRAEMIGAPLEKLIPERFRASHREQVERFAAGPVGSRGMGERGAGIVGLRRDGQEFPADAAISRLEVDGTTILTVALREITAQKV